VSSVIRFDLLNYYLHPREIIDVPINSPDFPQVRRLVLSPYLGDQRPAFGSAKPQRMIEATAFAELDGGGNEIEIQRKGEGFMDWICWLLSLAAFHMVYYWGAHHYVKEGSSWRHRSSLWKTAHIKDWHPRETIYGRVFDGTVLEYRLPEFLTKALKRISDEGFPRNDFKSSLHILLDATEDETIEIQYIKSWVALENLVNQKAQSDGTMYVFGRPKSSEFKTLRARVADAIAGCFPVSLSEQQRQQRRSLLGKLSELERVPVKILIKGFFDGLPIRYDEKDLGKIKEVRDGLLHYAELRYDSKETWHLLQVLRGLVGRALCQMVEWDSEKEIRSKRTVGPRVSAPDYIMLSGDRFEQKASGTGVYETEDGTHRFDCRGIARWTRREIRAKVVVGVTDLKQLFDVAGSSADIRCTLTTGDGSKLTIAGAKITSLENNRFNILGLEALRELK